jgi:hypothetical protein
LNLFQFRSPEIRLFEYLCRNVTELNYVKLLEFQYQVQCHVCGKREVPLPTDIPVYFALFFLKGPKRKGVRTDIE